VPADKEELSAEELAAILNEVRERVRARYPAGGAPVELADLMPLVHARDAMQGKVAAIGTVNPRPGGPLNALAQFGKRLLARALDWHVREQIEFNRAALMAVENALEAMNQQNRALLDLSTQLTRIENEAAGLKWEAERLKDIRSHWAEWRAGWERKLEEVETAFFHDVAEMQAAFQHRTALLESAMRETVKTQQHDFELKYDAAILEFERKYDAAVLEFEKRTLEMRERAAEIQQRTWADLDRIRLDYDRMIQTELRLIRQRGMPAAPEAAAAAPAPAPVRFDAARFAERFRGSAEYVREKQRFYLPFFQGRRAVLDAGCGRGEFLELMREAGVPARGIELDAEAVEACRARGLEAQAGDLFAYLAALEDGALDGIFSAQVVEHLPPQRLPEFARLAAAKLAPGGLLALETPNPECLAIFATHFYLDPTHQRPIPAGLLSFYLEEAGMGLIRVHYLSPAADSLPAVKSLPDDFREAFFGGLDYAILATKL
jgi:2-polyprenyl-3-methyl-5-hydroxy-6-metoxy-1,4-benzoquinol methylase